MLRYTAWRLVQIAITFFLYVTTVFFLFQAMPGDYTDMFIMNYKVPPEARELLAKRLGITGSLGDQYLNYIRNIFTGNLGVSFGFYPRTVWDIIAERLPRTAILFFTATLTAFALGYPLGRYIAWRRGRVADYGVTVVGVLFYTIFTPLLAIILLFVFANVLGWFKVGGFLTPRLWRFAPFSAQSIFIYLIATVVGLIGWGVLARLATRRIGHPRPRQLATTALTAVGIVAAAVGWWRSGIGEYAWDIVWHMILPLLELTLISFGGTMLLMRDSMLEVVREDYVTTARAKGLPDKVVRDKHAARTALMPVVTSFTLSIGFILSGGIITETLFSWEGMGLTYFNAMLANDYPLAMGCLVFTGVLALVAHLVADLLYAFLDPRITY